MRRMRGMGCGNTVYAYSALISAYAKSRYCDETIRVFETKKDSSLKPNLVTFNGLIDACGKDRITYNSLLAVCSGAGLWEPARSLFGEMLYRGIDQDIYTYNTLLDAACNGGHIDVAFDIMSEMPTKKILPNEVTYSTIIRGCDKAGRLALNIGKEMESMGIKKDVVTYNALLDGFGK
ncbi:Hypothetical predicted protein [Olea europaea subsp. europaea]|uniref:Pentatricopeptide repeat-containing protein n=1 Tax=Olea europaea subsp. europaea TaxID=158383 RepID=A0A8S0QLL0_OLEEU|nr:Hypothetical predicted protein [Olea europaea subsp. europaea]